MHRLIPAALCATLFACGGSDKEKFTATMNAANERQSLADGGAVVVNSPATGTATFTVNGQNLDYTMAGTGFTTNVTAGHIHAPADTNTSTGVYIGLPVPTGGTDFNINGTLTPGDVADAGTGKSMDELLGFMRNGQAYVNVHTKNPVNGASPPGYPNGEIRGQLHK